MKNLFVGIRSLIFILILASCGGPNKSTDNQSVNSAADQSTANSEAMTTADSSNMNVDKESTGNQLNESMNGSQIVDNSVSGLTKRLSLTEQQASGIKEILMKNFQASGEDLNKTYTGEQAKTIHLSIIQKSFDQIMGILDANQKEQFNIKFGTH